MKTIMSYFDNKAIILFMSLSLLLLVCSCDTSDSDVEEFANWEVTNAKYFQSLSDSVINGQKGSDWVRLLTWTKTDSSSTKLVTDYIIVHKLQNGDVSSESPVFTDSVAVQYLGRLLPSKSYPKGLIFDSTGYGEAFNPNTFTTQTFNVGNVVIGFSTALQNMHKGDLWRVYIPHTLGYGESGSGSIPGYSILVFDLRLVNFFSK